jgi:chromosomal replication initiation ATPase DnaA
LEDVKHGFIYGSQDFVSDLRVRFLENIKNMELPQHNSLFKEFNSDVVLDRAARILAFNIETAHNALRISSGEKDKRDLLIYFLWETGQLSNREIGSFFGLTYSAVSRCVQSINDRISRKRSLKKNT